MTSVTGLGGLQMQSSTASPMPGPNGAWFDPNTKIEYYHKTTDDRSEEERLKAVRDIENYKKDQ